MGARGLMLCVVCFFFLSGISVTDVRNIEGRFSDNDYGCFQFKPKRLKCEAMGFKYSYYISRDTLYMHYAKSDIKGEMGASPIFAILFYDGFNLKLKSMVETESFGKDMLYELKRVEKC